MQKYEHTASCPCTMLRITRHEKAAHDCSGGSAALSVRAVVFDNEADGRIEMRLECVYIYRLTVEDGVIASGAHQLDNEEDHNFRVPESA